MARMKQVFLNLFQPVSRFGWKQANLRGQKEIILDGTNIQGDPKKNVS